MEKSFYIFPATGGANSLKPRAALGFFRGTPLFLSHIKNLSADIELPLVTLKEVSPLGPTDDDELTEFRLLNHKDRVIVRGLGDGSGPMVFGRVLDDKDNGGGEEKIRFIAFDMSGTLVARGPVVIHKIANTDGGPDEASEESENESHCGGDQDRPQKSNTLISEAKYHGHLTLNLGGIRSIIQLNNASAGTHVKFLGRRGRFTIEKLVPHRFQQRTIVQRQRETLQVRCGLLAFETFEDLLN